MTSSTQRRHRAAVAASAGAALAASAMAAQAAEAAIYTKNECTAHKLCLWSQGGFANNWKLWGQFTAVADYEDYNYDFTAYDSEDNLGDSVSAVWNNTKRYAMLFRNDTYGSNRICFPPGTAVRDLHTVKLANGPIVGPGSGDSWGNRISSHRMYVNKPSDCTADGSTTVPSSQQGCSM
jgi:hypothetical protein